MDKENLFYLSPTEAWGDFDDSQLEQTLTQWFNERKTGIFLAGPAWIAQDKKTWPFHAMTQAFQDEPEFFDFNQTGEVILMDVHRNLLFTASIRYDDWEAEESPESLKEQHYGMQREHRFVGSHVEFEVVERMGIANPDQTVGRFQIIGLMPKHSTNMLRFRVGNNEKTFEEDLQKSLQKSPGEFIVLSPETLSRDQAFWTPAEPQKLPEPEDSENGVLQATMEVQGPQTLLQVHAQLPLGWGEKVNPQDAFFNSLPEKERPLAITHLHLVVMDDRIDHREPGAWEGARTYSLRLPVYAFSGSDLLGHWQIHLNALFPQEFAQGNHSVVYVFSKAAMCGPVKLP